MTPRQQIALDVLKKLAMVIGILTTYAVTALVTTVGVWYWFFLEDHVAIAIGLATPIAIAVAGFVTWLFIAWDASRRKIEEQDQQNSK